MQGWMEAERQPPFLSRAEQVIRGQPVVLLRAGDKMLMDCRQGGIGNDGRLAGHEMSGVGDGQLAGDVQRRQPLRQR